MIARLAVVLAAVACGIPDAGGQTIAITHARIISMSPAGDIRDGTVLVRDGRIVAVGASVDLPPDVARVDAKGAFLTPGFILAPTPLALRDVIGNDGGRASRLPALSAAYEVADDFNPRHPHVAEARAEGVTRALLSPDPQSGDRLFAGQTAIVGLGGSEPPRRNVALYLSARDAGSVVAGGGMGALRVRLKRALSDARAYLRDPAAFDLARLQDTGLSRDDLLALAPVVTGREPLLIEVDRAQAILAVLDIAREEKVRIVLSGAAEGWLVAPRLAADGIPVIVDGEINQADDFDALNATAENAALLVRAGVRIGFKPTFSRVAILDRSPRWAAGRAARYGLRLHDALAAITINPARMFGIDGSYGSIEPGKQADLVRWSGDPLELSTIPTLVMIGGVVQPLGKRGDALRDRYLGGSAGRVPAFEHGSSAAAPALGGTKAASSVSAERLLTNIPSK